MVSFEENMNLVPFVVHRYFPEFVGDEDAFQDGYIALWKSCSLYKPGKYQFSTYAVRGIMNALHNRKRDIRRGFPARCCIDIDSNLRRLPRSLDPNYTQADADMMLAEFKVKLKPKEAELLDLLLQGYNQRQIAKVQGVTHQWVSQQAKSLRKRLDHYLKRE